MLEILFLPSLDHKPLRYAAIVQVQIALENLNCCANIRG